MSSPDLLATIGKASAQRANELDKVICDLIVQGAELGALEDRELRLADGSTRTIRIIPRIWLERLQRAVNVGAFDRLTIDEIVQRILLPPLPESAEK